MNVKYKKILEVVSKIPTIAFKSDLEDFKRLLQGIVDEAFISRDELLVYLRFKQAVPKYAQFRKFLAASEAFVKDLYNIENIVQIVDIIDNIKILMWLSLYKATYNKLPEISVKEVI